MRISTTTGILDRYYDYEEMIKMLAKAGFDAIDFNFASHDDKNEGAEAQKKFYQNLKAVAEAEGVCFNQAHAHFPSSITNKEEDAKRFELIVQEMRNSAYMGVENIVVHPCQHLTYTDNEEALYEYNMDFYKRLIPYCEEYGIHVAAENMWQSVSKNGSVKILHSTCSRPAEFNRYIDDIGSEWIVGCLDIGHAMLVSEDPAQFVRAMGNKRLKCLHVHEVNGHQDSHTLPYLGVIDWESVMLALKDINYTGDLTFEAHKFYDYHPKELLPSCAKHMAETGRVLANIAGL